MKKMLKNFAVAAATTSAVAFGAPSASAVSFTVVIDKIELMTNGNSGTRIPVYQPSAGIGETATRTIDLFDSTQKAGTTLTIANPPAGTYETMIVTFEDIAIKQDTGAISATTGSSLGTQIVAGVNGTATELGKTVMVFGDVGSGAGSIDTQLGLTGTGVPAGPIQSIVHTTGNLTLPTIDFFLPSSQVNIDTSSNASGTISVIDLPQPIPELVQSGDKTNLPNVVVGVKHNAFRGTSEIPDTATTFTGRVGLFTDALNPRPVLSKAVTFASSTALTDASVTEVTFIDVPYGTYLPLAWIDTDSDGLLDTGEPTIMSDGTDEGVDLTAATGGGADHENFIQLVEANLETSNVAPEVSTASAAFEASTAGGALGNEGFGGGAHQDGYLGQSGNFFTFPARAISVTVEVTEDGSVTLGDNTDDCAACALNMVIDAAANGTTASTASAAVSITVGQSVYAFTTRLDDSPGAGDALSTGDAVEFAFIDNAGDIGADSMSGVSYNGATGILTLSPVPLTAMTSLDNADGLGTYAFTVAAHLLDGGTSVGSTDSASVGSATGATYTVDTDQNYTAATATVALPDTALSTIVGNDLGN
jgi:hypothetical protein